jgi:hypothetical protein
MNILAQLEAKGKSVVDEAGEFHNSSITKSRIECGFL